MANSDELTPDPFRDARARLRAWREARKLKGKDIKALLGISPSFWSDLETGRKRPDAANAQLIEAVSGGVVRADEWLTPEERARIATAKLAAQAHGDGPKEAA